MNDNQNPDIMLDDAIKGIYDLLTDEQKVEVKRCKTIEELSEFAAKENLELPDEVLEAVSGGCGECQKYYYRVPPL